MARIIDMITDFLGFDGEFGFSKKNDTQKATPTQLPPVFVDYGTRSRDASGGVSLSKKERDLHKVGELPELSYDDRQRYAEQDRLDQPKAAPVKKVKPMNTVYDTLKSVLRAEEGYKTDAYIPTRNGQAIGKSGVTIGKGFDMGQFNVDQLKKMGIKGGLLNKISPYVGITGRVAQKKLNQSPLNLSETEVEALDDAVLRHKFAKIDGVIGDIEKNSGRKLTENQKVALGSMIYQGISPSSFPNSFKAFVEGDIEKARKGFLNSKWAREQTPERAQRTIKSLLDDLSMYQAEDELVSLGIIGLKNRAHV